MKSALKTALTAALRRCAYFAALFQLRALETNLAGACEALPAITDQNTRLDTVHTIKRLSLAVVDARNRVRALQPARKQQAWRLA